MANILTTNPIVIDDDSANVDIGWKNVQTLLFHSDAAGTCTILDGAGGNKVCKLQVDGTSHFTDRLYLGNTRIKIFITQTTGLTGTNPTLYIYLA